MQMRSAEVIHTESKMPKPANIAFAGGNGFEMVIRNKLLG
jgi:hypothetical protein